MKRLSTYLSIQLLFILSANSQLNWSNEITVADDNIYGSSYAHITEANGVPIVCWGNKANGKVYTARWNGSSFDTPVEITVPGISASVQDLYGPDIAARGNDVFVVFDTDPVSTGTIYLRKSSDGGLTYGDTVRAELLDSGYGRYPTVTVMPDGNPLVMWMEHEHVTGETKWMVSKSTDGGLSFSSQTPASSVVPGSVACDCCMGALLNNDDKVVALFRNNNSNVRDMHAAISNDTAISFTNYVDYDNSNWVTATCPSSGPDGIVDGNTLTSVFYSGHTSPYRAYVSQADISTGTVSVNTVSFNTPTVTTAKQNFPRIAGNNDTLGIVWEQNTAGSIESVFTYSTNTIGNINSSCDTINKFTPGNQRVPDLTYANRTFYFVFLDWNTKELRFRFASFDPITQVEAVHLESYSLYPNPTGGSLTLDIPANYAAVSVKLLDQNGKLVYERQLNRERRVELPGNLPDGLYNLQILNNGNPMGISKVMIQK